MEQPGYGIIQFFRIADRKSGNSHRPRKGCQIRIVGNDRLRTVAAVKHALPLIDHPEDVIVENDDLDVDAVLMKGSKFLTVHHDAAVAGKEDDRRLRTAYFRSHGRRKAVAHGSQAAGG